VAEGDSLLESAAVLKKQVKRSFELPRRLRLGLFLCCPDDRGSRGLASRDVMTPFTSVLVLLAELEVDDWSRI
jgi:hypothetical protein